MKNKVYSIKKIFLKRMVYSAIAQIFLLYLIILITKKYFYHAEINNIYNNLIINDQYTKDHIAKFYLLKNENALNLELYNFRNDKDLDAIELSDSNKNFNNEKYSCIKIKNNNAKLCHNKNGVFYGITDINISINKKLYVISKKMYNNINQMPLYSDLILILTTVLGVFIFNFFFLFLSMMIKIKNNTSYLIDFIYSNLEDKKHLNDINIEEYNKIVQAFINKKEEIITLQKKQLRMTEEQIELKKNQEYYETIKSITLKVAHDVRSPTIAISNAVADTPEIPEKKRILINKAARSINHIANNLLKDYIISKNYDSISNELIFVIVNNIVSSKEKEYENKNIEFRLKIENESYSCFSLINLSNFERVISNLINNSVESIHHNDGIIIVSMTNTVNSIIIKIEDNGSGIKREIISKVTDQGFSYGKNSGTGLGLYYAKKQIEQIDGRLLIHSTVDKGTIISLELKRANPPTWFCSNLNISENSTILVLDDEPSIHEIWHEKLKDHSNIKLLDFYDSESLDKNLINNINADLYLIDYQLLRNKINGLDLIKKFNLEKKSFLVTNNFEDTLIRNWCDEINLKIIPKPYVPFINIEINKKISQTKNVAFNTDLIISIIDDENEVLEEWRKLLGSKNIFYFLTPDEFMNEFINNPDVSKTNLIITDYYFDNRPVNELLDFILLKEILKFKGKIFLFSNIGKINSLPIKFDFIFPSKIKYFNKSELEEILLNIK